MPDEFNNLTDENVCLRQELEDLASDYNALQIDNDDLSRLLTSTEDNVDHLEEKVAALEAKLEEWYHWREDEATPLIDELTESISNNEGQRKFFGQVLIAIAFYGGDDPTVPAELAAVAVKGLLQ